MESNILLTPTKLISSVENVLMQTPESTSCNQLNIEGNGECELLMGTFSGLKISNAAGALKRSADLMTVEGTPINLTKRIDLHSTPNIRLLSSTDEQKSQIVPTVADGEEFSATNNLRPLGCSAVTMTSALQSTHPRKVLIISAGSDDHDTGDHQENALRTELLCGPNGCLRRGLLGMPIHHLFCQAIRITVSSIFVVFKLRFSDRMSMEAIHNSHYQLPFLELNSNIYN